MRAFITGSTGLLGNNLVRALVAGGHTVRALARSSAKAEAQLEGLRGVEVVTGDLDDVGAFAPALDGVDVVFHTAAYFREYFGRGEHEARLQALNVDATVALARAAHARGVGRFVHTSSSGTIRDRDDGGLATEADAHPTDALPNRYFASKVRADLALTLVAEEIGIDVVTILPGWMFGPGDAAPTSAGKLVQDALAGRLPPVALPGGTSIVDARDVAVVMARAAEAASPHDRFIVAGRHASLAEVIGRLAELTGRAPPRATLPYAAAWGFAAAQEAFAWLTSREPLVTRMALATLNTGHHLSSAHAENTLGATFRPLGETLEDTVAWYRARAEAPLAAPGARGYSGA